MYDVQSLIGKAKELAGLASSRALKDFEISYYWDAEKNIIVRNLHTHKYTLAMYTEEDFIDAVMERFLKAQLTQAGSNNCIEENQKIIQRTIGDHGNTSLTMHFLDLVHPDSNNEFFVMQGIPDASGKLELINIYNVRGAHPFSGAENVGMYSRVMV